MALIGTINRALLYSATAYYVDGQPITVLDAQGNVVLGDAPPAAPEIISTITDRVYEVGTGPYTIDLSTKFSGAGSYVVTPTNANLSLSGVTLTITPTTTLAQTTISVIGRNGGGDSEPLTFALTINAAAPTVTTPLPDQSLSFGTANVSIPLDSYFSGVASYAVSPAANGATISGRNLVLSAAQTRSLEITVTGTNSTGQSVSDAFLFAVTQTTQAPSVLTIPTISGDTTVGSIPVRTAGTASGIPSPARRTEWLVNDVVDLTQTGNSFNTTGLTEGDVITTRDVWTNTINGEVQTATGTSDPYVLTVQPAIAVDQITDPLVEAQSAQIVFNTALTAAPTATGVTFTGSGTTWDFIVPDDITALTIGASKSGWKSFGETYEVVAPDAGAFDVASKSYPTGVGPLTYDVSSQFDGTVTAWAVSGSPYASISNGIVTFDSDSITSGTMELLITATGATNPKGKLVIFWDAITVTYDGSEIASVSAPDDTPLDTEISISPTGGTYDGQTRVFTFAELGGDNDAVIPFVTAATDTFSAANGTLLVPGPHESGKTWDRFGSTASGAVIQDGFLLAGADYRFIKRSDDLSGGNYTVTFAMRSTINLGQTGYGDRGAHAAIGVKGLTTGFYLQNRPTQDALRIYKNAAGTTTQLTTRAGDIASDTDFTVTFVVTDHVNVAVLIDGVDVPELAFSDPDLQGGGVGIWNAAASGAATYNKINSLSVEIN